MVVRRVDAVMAGVSALSGLIDIARSLLFVLALIVPGMSTGFPQARSLATAEVAAAGEFARGLGATLMLIVGVRLLRSTPFRPLVLLASLVVIAGHVLSDASIVLQYPTLPYRAYYLGTFAILLMLPLANLVWFTRPAVKKLHRRL